MTAAAATVVPPQPSPAAVRGLAEVAFSGRDGQTRLTSLYQHDPLRVLFPSPPPGELTTAALVTTSGGLVGGDELTVRVAADSGAQALVTAQAAEKIYRSAGADCRIEMALRAGADAWLEWLPQETIIFEGARFRRRTVIEAAETARVLAGEFLVFGRSAMGETVTRGLVRDAWEVRVGGRLVWADALHLDAGIDRILAHPAGLGGATACATAVYVGADAAGYLEPARELLAGSASDTLRGAATLVNGVLVARWLAAEAGPLRTAFGRYWAQFRHEAAGLPEALPRLWHI